MSPMMPGGRLPPSPIYRGPHTTVIEAGPLTGCCPCRRGETKAPCIEPAGADGGPCGYCERHHGRSGT